MKYTLESQKDTITLRQAAADFLPFIRPEISRMLFTMIVVIINAVANVIAPYLLGRAIDDYITTGDRAGVVQIVIALIIAYLVAALSNYATIISIGRIGQRILYRLRQQLFDKLHSLPIAFFHQNTSGDLISRITNDTNIVNTLFAETLVRLLSNIFTLIGIGVFIVFLHRELGIATISVAVILFVVTRFSNSVLQRVNKKSLDTVGNYSAEVQTQIENMKAIIAFRRRDYFVNTLEIQNNGVLRASKIAGITNGLIAPLYNFAGNIAQVVILLYGLYLISQDALTIGVLISFIAYASKFFEPLRIIASLWGSVQKAIAGWKRIIAVLQLQSSLVVHPDGEQSQSHNSQTENIVSFSDVSFGYEEGSMILHKVHFDIAAGQTVALVGPTGGGKSTLASLMMRLYDTTAGTITFCGRNIHCYSTEELSQKIGFIIQDPIVFSGTVGENIVLGHPDHTENYSADVLQEKIDELGLQSIIDKFQNGLDTRIEPEKSSLSIGQKQLIAFMRAILRKPELLILDEATANIDTVTEQLLEEILAVVSKDITVVIIAHRLNTIESADQIIFVQNGRVHQTMSFDEAVELIDNSQS